MELYNALILAGVDEDKAKEAAKAVQAWLDNVAIMKHDRVAEYLTISAYE